VTDKGSASIASIIDGKVFAEGLRARIGAAVSKIKDSHNITPGLAVVLVGEDPASQVYVRNKGRATEGAGMASFTHQLSKDISEEELLGLIVKLNNDDAVDGILVQLPLPSHINSETVIEAIDPTKDVDGFHLINVGKLAAGMKNAFVPCTPQGCIMMLRDELGSLEGMHAVVLGRSNIVGKPMASLLLAENCTVTIAHSKTKNIAVEAARADILVAAVGRPQMIKGSWIKPGACVIDVGINRIEGDNGKMRLVGDVDFDEAIKVAGFITPVPGGVGPMTIACLLRNTVIAACLRAGIDVPEI
jgi:methylenetetrahydrofolate dehydrogenase (NADP+)/methenyltetrahydrofolate cyclohydrolase